MVLEKRKPLIAYVISIFYLLLVVVTYNSLNPNLLRIGFWLSILGFGIWLAVLFRSNRPLCYPRIFLPIAAYLLIRLITISLAPLPIISLEVVLRELLLLLGFIFVFNSLYGAWKTATWENALINFAIVFSIIELCLAFLWHRNWWDIAGSITSLPPIGYRSPGVFLGHSNVLAGFLIIVAPIMVVRLIREKNWGKRILWGIGLLLFIPTVFFTSSRTGLIAGVAGVSFTLVLLYVPNLLKAALGDRSKPITDIIKPRYLILALFLIIIVIGFIVFFLAQSTRISSHAPTLISARSEIWGPAFDIIRESPILGRGPGSFSVFFAELTKIPPGFATSHAHNILLQTAAETGIIGVVLVLSIIVGLIIIFIRTWRIASPQTKFRLAAYAGAGVAVLLHHSLDYLLESPLYALSVYILLALTLHEAPPEELRTLHRKSAISITASLVVILIAGSIYTTLGATDYWDGVNAGREGDWEIAAEELCGAYDKQSSVTLHGFQCSLAHAQLYHLTSDPESLQEAITIQREALDNDPYWPIHWANLATYQWTSVDQAAAIEHMQQALDLAPNNPTFALNLALMKENIGDTEGAIDAYLSALKINSSLQLTDSFISSPLAKEAVDRYYQNPPNAGAASPTLNGLRALSSNQFKEAEALFMQAIDANPADARAYAGLALVDQQFGRSDEAQYHAQVATFLNSTSPHIQHAAGLVALQQGREKTAYRYFQRAFDLVEDRSYSPSYYYRTYNRFFLASDLAHQMRRGDLTPEMIESFNLLAQYHEENGDLDKTRLILERLEIETGGY
ncbi:MAG: hypothetical protein GTO18_06560 [Anaerolineales bacterium]|nr:hypothetical protein [Anaerolineales bacterium]